ncbi:unnamed protein product [Prunus armeniaca]
MSAPSTDEVQLEINTNVEIGRASIYFSHGEACWMGRTGISSVWIGFEVVGLTIFVPKLYFSTCSANCGSHTTCSDDSQTSRPL